MTEIRPYSTFLNRGLRCSAGRGRLLAVGVLAVIVTVGCAGAAVAPENQAVTHISLQNMTCSSCVRTSAKAAESVPGVLAVEVDLKQAELRVRYDRSRASAGAVIRRIHTAGYTAVVGAGKGGYKAHVIFTDVMDVKQLKEPSPSLDISSLLVAGKVTVVDYGAAWCAPCRKVDREMYAQLLKHKQLALRRLDIGDWSSAFAKKHLAEVNTLPFVLVFDANKKQIARMEGLDLAALRAAIDGALARIGH